MAPSGPTEMESVPWKDWPAVGPSWTVALISNTHCPAPSNWADGTSALLLLDGNAEVLIIGNSSCEWDADQIGDDSFALWSLQTDSVYTAETVVIAALGRTSA